MEIWKQSAAFPDYEVSDLGHVRGPRGDMRLTKTSKGYVRITLRGPTGRKMAFVHRLVGEAFVPNPGAKPFVNHINGVHADNRAENLEWVTCQENIMHKHYVLKHPTPLRSGGRKAMYSEADIERAKGFQRNGHSLRSIAAMTGISHGHLSKLLRGMHQYASR